jgi:hypothetical protein
MLVTCMSVMAAVWASAYGYVWGRLGEVEHRCDRVGVESVDIKTQLSQIQTDLQWIKLNLSK